MENPSLRSECFSTSIPRSDPAQARAERQPKVTTVDALNEELRMAKQPRQRDPIMHKIKSLLEKLKLMEMYEVRLTQYLVQGATKPITSWQVSLQVKEDVERNSRRYDGITLLVAHPDVDSTLHDAISDYRQKNQIEANFRTIKSVLNIRPTFHRTDPKIRAHVTICVLSLLAERLIEKCLSDNGALHLCRTAHALLEELDQVRLVSLRVNNTPLALRTQASERAVRLLQALSLTDLLDSIPAANSVPASCRY
jgi:hypothetical protein